MRDSVSEVYEGGQEPVDEDQPVLRAGTDRPLPEPGGKPGLMPFVPQRTCPGSGFSDHISRQARDPPVAGDRCTRRVPHHRTMIDDQEPGVSPPTVHEVVTLTSAPSSSDVSKSCSRLAISRPP
ncbi:hypothetical protein GCM10010266_65380 [Streptomyces griseomycini]|nr:hypothetical protein GCM10010266_65380 [Streptomyces griseomycini]GGR36195.1 hypothetical protein GCM10015536_47500 [Streptomyces griseomycini]